MTSGAIFFIMQLVGSPVNLTKSFTKTGKVTAWGKLMEDSIFKRLCVTINFNASRPLYMADLFEEAARKLREKYYGTRALDGLSQPFVVEEVVTDVANGSICIYIQDYS